MKKILFAFTITMLFSSAVFSQQQGNVTTIEGQQSSNTVLQNSASEISSDTHIVAQLQNTLDVKKAKVGDEVVLKTTEAIKSNGRVVVKKGARLIGRVTEVQKKSKEENDSYVNLVFDRLSNGSEIIPINATITSITQAANSTSLNKESLGVDTGLSSQSGASSGSSSKGGGGGLLGGVTNTVGGVLNTTTQTVGSTVSTTTNTVGSTTQSLGNTLGNIQISNSTQANADGSTMLSLSGENLKLEKGTTFQLRLSESTNVKKN